MKPIATLLAALTLGAGVAACGSSNSNTTSSRTSSNPSSSQSTTSAVGQAKSQGSRLMVNLQGVLAGMATSAGQLATGNSASEHTARVRLTQLQTQASTLAAKANRQLPPGSPAQTLVSQLSQQARMDAGRLKRMKVTPADRQKLRSAQSTLHGLSGQVGKAARNLSAASPTKITHDVERLAQELTA